MGNKIDYFEPAGTAVCKLLVEPEELDLYDVWETLYKLEYKYKGINDDSYFLPALVYLGLLSKPRFLNVIHADFKSTPYLLPHKEDYNDMFKKKLYNVGKAFKREGI